MFEPKQPLLSAKNSSTKMSTNSHTQMITRIKKSLNRERKLSTKGQGLVEVCVGAIFLVVIGLAILDLGTFVMGGDICGGLAKQAARAAGNAADPNEAALAVQDVATKFRPSPVYKNLSLTLVNFDNTTTGAVKVVCQVTIVLPVSIPLLAIGPEYTIKTQATEPIVGIAPAPQT